MQVRAALSAFRAREGLPPNGTDGAWLDWASAFGVPVPIVNTRSRLDVLPYHDLHHLMTGYRTDEAGEAEISAWTLATGGGPPIGRLYDLAAYLLGIRFPRRTVAAYARGRRARNLYGRPLEELLDEDLDRLRADAGPAEHVPTASDVARAAGWFVVAGVVWLGPLAGLALLVLALA